MVASDDVPPIDIDWGFGGSDSTARALEEVGKLVPDMVPPVDGPIWHLEGMVFAGPEAGTPGFSLSDEEIASLVTYIEATGYQIRDDVDRVGYDEALETAREAAGDLGYPHVEQLYDPETGTLLGERSEDALAGWRIDPDHVNWWDWRDRGSGGSGHEYFHVDQMGPSAPRPSVGKHMWELKPL